MGFSSRAGRYEEEDIQALLDHYFELRDIVQRPASPRYYATTSPRLVSEVHVRLMDLDKALWQLPRKLFGAVLVYGILRFQERPAGEALHISHTAAKKRYRQGLEQMLLTMNGE